MSASGEYRTPAAKILPPTSTHVDVGRMAIGQDKLQVTPLQMAIVVAAVANGGVLMKPRLGNRIIDRDGRATQDHPAAGPEAGDEPETAATLTQMMATVVQRGTGTAAQLPGIQVAGKTGTAEIETGGTDQPARGSSASRRADTRGSPSP